jgi:Tol biopolymer transport system component/DNA-binding winged helix-turn-helix (wHTH) protein
VGEDSGRDRRPMRFGAFELDPRAGELRKADVRVSLQEQPFKVLECLLQRPGELITREELRQRLWPADTFVDFEHGVNAAVKRLRETLGDSAETPRFVETVPRRGYRFIAPVERAQTPVDAHSAPAVPAVDQRVFTEPAARPNRGSARVVGAGVVGLLVVGLFGAWLLSRSSKVPAPPMKVVALTLLKGSAIGADFSGDGTRVAFTWNGQAPDNFDIYVQLTGSAEPQPLSSDPAFEANPIWSPDDMRIAYLRFNPEANALNVWVMPAIGGRGYELSALPVSLGISWSPDGRYIIAAREPPNSGVYRISLQSGEPHALFQATAPGIIRWPALSPDGRLLAYAACREPIYRSDCRVETIAVDAAGAIHGEPRRLTRKTVWSVEGITWGRDSQFLVYGADEQAALSLWRVGVDGKRPPARIELAGHNATAPRITRSGGLVFSRRIEDQDVYRLQLGRPAEAVARSAVFDGSPQFSPDGLRFAFCSARSADVMEVWTAASDGSDAHRLTHGPGAWQCSPAWSPDGTQIAFDSLTDDGEWHIWTVASAGGIPRPLTREPGKQNVPTWSYDGEWIYFSWEQGGTRDIWRIHLKNGTREPVTRGGAGIVGRESADRQSVIYQPKTFDAPLLAQPLGGGASRPILPCVADAAYSVRPAGIYYVPCQDPAHPHPNRQLRLLNPGTGEDRLVGDLEGFTRHLAVSPDGQTILYSRLASSRADLMMIQDFR